MGFELRSGQAPIGDLVCRGRGDRWRYLATATLAISFASWRARSGVLRGSPRAGHQVPDDEAPLRRARLAGLDPPVLERSWRSGSVPAGPERGFNRCGGCMGATGHGSLDVTSGRGSDPSVSHPGRNHGGGPRDRCPDGAQIRSTIPTRLDRLRSISQTDDVVDLRSTRTATDPAPTSASSRGSTRP